MADKVEIKEGTTFVVEVAPNKTIEEIRKDALKLYGREVHIKAKIGPALIVEADDEIVSVECPIEVVDDRCLDFEYKGSVPLATGEYVLVGYFK